MSDKPSGDTSTVEHKRFTFFFHAFMNPEYPDLFVFTNPEYLESVVRSTLDWREQASNEARQAFDAAIRDNVAKLDGFRPQNVHRAPSTSLQEPVLGAALCSDELAGGMLRVWAETHKSLHDAIVKHLDGQDMPTLGPDFSEHRFRGVWDFDSWQKERDRVVQLYGDQYLEDDVALMLCYVSGKMPCPPSKKVEGAPDSTSSEDIFANCLDYLQRLPPEAPEWEQVIPEFVERVSQISEEKEAERHQAANLDTIIAEIGDKFSDELNYLEQSISSWSAARLSSASATSEALALAAELKDSLEGYRPIRERAPVRSEELIRAEERTELESGILSTVDSIHNLMSGGPSPDDDAPQPWPEPGAEAGEDAPVGQPQQRDGAATGGTASDESARGYNKEPPNDAPRIEDTDGTNTDAAPPVSEISGLTVPSPETVVAAEPAFSEEDYAPLQLENQDLYQDVEYLKEEVESLRSDLHNSRTMEESWRLAYQKERQEPAPEDVVQPPPIDDVNTAVKLAKQQFKGQLLVQPNSESDIETNPFNTPQAVWEALRWLATTYYQSRTGALRMTDFNQSIHEICRWWYKSDQHDSTMRRYRNSYSTQVNGKRYWLAEHVGKGTSRDARYTIRIGFDWDRDLKKVVVGFIGQHQQTDAS